jgi:hypothetical protein
MEGEKTAPLNSITRGNGRSRRWAVTRMARSSAWAGASRLGAGSAGGAAALAGCGAARGRRSRGSRASSSGGAG